MPEKPMSPERAIIVLNNLNTDGRIEVDRDELRAAIAVAKGAVQKSIRVKPFVDQEYEHFECPNCLSVIIESQAYCCNCGKAIDWGAEFPHKAKLFGIWSDDDGR